MRYLVLIGHDEKGGKRLSAGQHEALFTAYQKYELELKKAGVLLGGDPLQPSDGHLPGLQRGLSRDSG